MSGNKTYNFDKLAKVYNTPIFQFFCFLAHSSCLRFLKNTFKDNLNILDIACGTGTFTKRLTKIKNGLRVFGIDNSKGMISIANKKNVACFKTANAEEIPFPDNYFDLITITDSFYYFKDKDKSISECCRILKTNSHLFIYTPYADSFFSRLLIKFGQISPTEKGSKHLKFLEIKNIAEKYGLIIVNKKIKYYPLTPFKYWLLLLVKN